MSWSCYITYLTQNSWVDDAVIIGHAAGEESVLASVDGGWLSRVSPAEVQAIVAKDRNNLSMNGLTLVGKKCRVLIDSLNDDGLNVMEIKRLEPLSFFFIGKTHKALIIAKGSQDANRGHISQLVCDLTKRVRILDD